MTYGKFAVALLAATSMCGPAAAAEIQKISYRAPEPSAGAPAAPGEGGRSAGHTTPQIEEIIVTARRREEQSQDVPLAVTSLSGAAIKAASITRVDELMRVVPSLSITSSAFGSSVPRFMIRGQTTSEPLTPQDPSVNVYFADAVFAHTYGVNNTLFDIESVQVLKGPQGTLFGRNATGGAIVITPRAPTHEFNGYVSGTVGNLSNTVLEGAANIPLADWAAIRISGNITKRDGYVHNIATNVDLNDRNSKSFRAVLKLWPSAQLTNQTVVYNTDQHENGTAFAIDTVGPALSSPLFYGPDAPQAAAYAAAEIARRRHDFYSVDNDIPPGGTKVHTFGVSNVTTWDVTNHITLKNLASYRFVDSVNYLDFDGTSFKAHDANGVLVPLFNSQDATKIHQYTEELQALGKVGIVDYIAGFYYFLEKANEQQTTVITRAYRSYRGQPKNESFAGFAQADIHLDSLLHGLTATAGVRYTRDWRSITWTSIDISPVAGCRVFVSSDPNNPASTPVRANPCIRTGKVSFGKATYTLGLNWKFDDKRMLYVTTRSGYRSGGFNLRARLPAEFQPFQPENVKDWEVGLKADWDLAGTPLRTNVAGFRQKYRNIQRTIGIGVLGQGTATIIANAARATISGFELETTWLPTSFLDLGFNYAYTKAKYDRFIDGAGNDQSAGHFAYVPKSQLNAYARVHHDLGDIGELSARLGVYHQSQVVTADVADTNYTLPAVTVWNARMTWTGIYGSKVDGAVYVDNLTNKKYSLSKAFAVSTLGLGVRTIEPPRTYGVELSYAF